MKFYHQRAAFAVYVIAFGVSPLEKRGAGSRLFGSGLIGLLGITRRRKQ
jgi:hypothetical protein